MFTSNVKTCKAKSNNQKRSTQCDLILLIEYVEKRRAWDTYRSHTMVYIIAANLDMSIYNIEGQICVNCNFCLHQTHTCSQKQFLFCLDIIRPRYAIKYISVYSVC